MPLIRCPMSSTKVLPTIFSRNHKASWNQRYYRLSLSSSRRMATVPSDPENYVFQPAPVSCLPIVGTEKKFPVRRVYCVGKNYADHVVEMGGDAKKNKPVFFTKPNVDGVVHAGKASDGTSCTTIAYPPNTNNLHFEVELVVAIGKELSNESNLDTDCLLESVYGYAVGIDLTRRDLQNEAKSKRWPWDTGKYFDQSAPIGPISPKIPDISFESELDKKIMTLELNGIVQQNTSLQKMIWKVPEIITELCKSFRLKPGDLVMTGTPSGVGPVVVGDRLVGTIKGLVEPVDIRIV